MSYCCFSGGWAGGVCSITAISLEKDFLAAAERVSLVRGVVGGSGGAGRLEVSTTLIRERRSLYNCSESVGVTAIGGVSTAGAGDAVLGRPLGRVGVFGDVMSGASGVADCCCRDTDRECNRFNRGIESRESESSLEIMQGCNLMTAFFSTISLS